MLGRRIFNLTLACELDLGHMMFIHKLIIFVAQLLVRMLSFAR